MINIDKINEPVAHAVIFQEKTIRRTWYNEEWWFSVVDVCGVLADSSNAGAYWRKLKQRLGAEGSEPVTFCHVLKLEAPDGKQRLTDCANTEGLFRIIQTIPSPKAEPFKRWLAKVGYERVKEIENPELAMGRMQDLYEKKGYPKEWIDKRLRGIAVRQDLTDEWKERGVASSLEFAILTFSSPQSSHASGRGGERIATRISYYGNHARHFRYESGRIQTGKVAGARKSARPYDGH